MRDPKLYKSIGISVAAVLPVLLVQVFGVEMAGEIAAVAVAALGPVVDKLRRMGREE